MAEFYVEQQYWKHWPKVLIMCRKNGRDVTHRRYVPEVKTGEGMGITDELRDCIRTANRSYEDVRNPCNDREILHIPEEELLAIADRIDAEHERQCAESWMRGHDAWAAIDRRKEMAEHGWVRLPMDANGEYIHAGDKLDGYGKTIEVVELRYGRSGWVLISRDGNGYADTFAFTHHHAPTVEDVLREMLDARGELPSNATNEAIVADYASKLQLREDA